MATRKKNYYKVLGVSPQEGEAGIRRAYREKAKKHHPDRAGKDSTARFQEIAEAYEVLSSPKKREEYDRDLAASRSRPRVQPNPVSAARVRPEPLVPRRGGHRGPGYRTPAEEIFRFLFEREAPGYGGVAETLEFELILDRLEAVPGAIVEFELPLHASCRFCGGTGRDWMFPCMACLGSGTAVSSPRIALRLPAFVRDGSRLEIPAEAAGLDSGIIRLVLRIA
ncbi:MAG: DnaJ domain-containing protein [Syntrophaceae bacterium]|nr:DnaJ domain-containing protein [Syntrophaceae bacterium]